MHSHGFKNAICKNISSPKLCLIQNSPKIVAQQKSLVEVDKTI